MSKLKLISPLILILLSWTLISAQIFPVQTTTQLVAPYSLYLSDYVSPATERLVVTSYLGDVSRELNVRFRLRIEGQGIIVETRPEYIPPPISIQGGVPLRLISADLAGYFDPTNLNFQGISRREYEQRGKLPEGVYQFCFEVLEYNRGVKISNTGCANAWMILNDPPIVNLPRQDEKVRPQSPQNVIMQWTPRHTGSPNSAFTTEYEVRMVEVWPATRNPNDAILTSPPIFETTTRSTTVIYGPAETPLELGRRYAFRVQAKSIVGVEELDLFKNHGYSEVVSFVYGDACTLPTGVQIESVSSNRFKVQWTGQFNHTSYKIRYRQVGTQNWYASNTSINEAEIYSLKPNTLYEYEVSGICGYFEGGYSTVAQVKTKEAPLSSYSCGLPLETFLFDPNLFTGSLKVGDIIQAGDFDVQVSKISGGNGVYTGEGIIPLTFLKNAKVKAEFTNVTVNKDLRLIKGEMNITGAGVDIIPEGMKDFMEKLDEGLDIADKGLTKLDEYIVDNVPNPESFVADKLIIISDQILAVVKNPVNNKVVITTTTGKVTELEPGQTYAVKDSKGKGYLVGADGGITSTTAEKAEKAANREYNLILSFNKSRLTKYGFDKKPTEPQYKSLIGYEELKGGYQVAWKAVATNNQDDVRAQLENSDLDKSKIRFEINGKPLPVAPIGGNDSTIVSATASSHGEVEDLVSFYTPSDTSKKEQLLGKLKVISYDGIVKKLMIVPVNNAAYPGIVSDLSRQLNLIYGQAAVTWTVEMAPKFEIALNESFDVGGTGLSNYTGDMKTVINAYKDKFTPDTYYIFLIDKPSDGKTAGFMPRSKEAGFVFVDIHGGDENLLIKTIAHELGHGAFTLKHTFDDGIYSIPKKSTDNLMDYENGSASRLFKHQWDRIHDPAVVLGLFEEDEDGALASLAVTDCGMTADHILSYFPTEYFTDIPKTEDELLKYVVARKLWIPGSITASLNAIAESIKKDNYFHYNSSIKAYTFDYQKWIADKNEKPPYSKELNKAKLRFDFLLLKFDYLLFNASNSKRCEHYAKGDIELAITSFLKNQIANGLLKPTNVNKQGKFIWNGKESNLPDPTKYFSLQTGSYDFDLLKKHLQYSILTQNENNQLNGSTEGNLFLEKRYLDILFLCGKVMITVGMDDIKGLNNDITKRNIINTFTALCRSSYDSDVYFKWQTLVSKREKLEYENKLRELKLVELAKKIEDAKASAKLDIIVGSVSIGFLIIFPPTLEGGVLLLLAEIAGGAYSADQVYGGIKTLSAIQEGMFDDKKEYQFVRGFLVDEGFNEALIIYDLGNILSGASVGVGDMKDLVDLRNLKSIVIMGSEVKRMLKSTDTTVGIYDTKGDLYSFIKE